MKKQKYYSAMAFPEFVCLMAFMISIVALSIDSMLPALSHIGEDLNIDNSSNVPLIVSALFFGLMIGQLLVGPLSDHFGRRLLVHIGFSIFIVGSLLCLFAKNFETMLIGRALQGLGAAAPRIITMAIVRDKYAGREMARTMSIIMAIFILVPVIAPAMGQGILFIGTWRSIFAALLALSSIGWLWFALRQPETLTSENRRVISVEELKSNATLFFSNKVAFGYTACTGIIFGAFLGYLNLSQQIFQQTYKTGAYFSLWFGCSAISIGFASIINSKLVMRLGMRPLIIFALSLVIITSSVFLCVSLWTQGVPPFWSLMLWLIISFACFGLVLGNLNALAMEPLGKIAGLGAALVGFVSTLISLPLSWLITKGYDGGMHSLALSFILLPVLAFAIVHFIERVKLRSG